MKKEMICICCPLGCRLTARIAHGGDVTVEGNSCPRGKLYATDEMTSPKRTVTSVVRVMGRRKMLSVKTSDVIPKELMFKALEELKGIEVSPPIKIGDIIVANAAGSGIPFVATKNID